MIRSPGPPAASGGFTDHFDAYDAARWSTADGWKNGSPYASGEPRTSGHYGYGCYQASFKPVVVPGVVTSLFTYAGPYDNGGNGSHNEIDVEFLGNRPGRVQLNFWTNDDAYTSRIEWFVDGNSFARRPTARRTRRQRRPSRCRRSWSTSGPWTRRRCCGPASSATRARRCTPSTSGSATSRIPDARWPSRRSILRRRRAAPRACRSGTSPSTWIPGPPRSSRSRTPGAVRFCVVDARAAGLSYAAEASLEGCDAITK